MFQTNPTVLIVALVVATLMCPRNIPQCRFIFTFNFLAYRHYILLLYKPLVGVGDNHHPENNPIFWVFVTQSCLELIFVKLKCTAIQHQGEEVWLLIEWQQVALLEPNNRKEVYTSVSCQTISHVQRVYQVTSPTKQSCFVFIAPVL